MKNMIKKCICITAIAGIAVMGVGCISNAEQQPQRKVVKYVVKKGDTLWNIAEKERADDEDVREVIYRISERNHLGQDLPAGTVLEIHEIVK